MSVRRSLWAAIVVVSVAPLIAASPAFLNQYRLFAARYVDRGALPAPALSNVEATDWAPLRPYEDAVPVLLYHGINDKDDLYSVSQRSFASQMLMLHEAGFHTISIAQYADFLRGDVSNLPPRPILLTFDDGRLDSYRGADAILAQYGFRATMFVIVGRSGDPFDLSWDELRQLARSGRWDVQEHAGNGHYLIPSGAGTTGPFYANRRYVRGALESWDLYQARVTGDVLWGERRLRDQLPGYQPYAFAVPYGNFGQDETNDDRIPAFLDGWLQSHFEAVFADGPASFTQPTDLHGDLHRLEIHTHTTADELYQWLAQHAPDPRFAWQSSIGGAIFSSPAASDGRVFIGSEDGAVCAFDARTGALIWVARTSGSVLSSPVEARGTVYVGSSDGRAYAFGAASGNLRWSAPVGIEIQSSPAVDRGVVYVGSQDGRFSALDSRTGARIWTATTGGYIVSSPAVTRNAVFVGSGDGRLYAFVPSTGARIWIAKTDNSIDSSPALAQGRVYVGSEDEEVYAFDGRTGQKLWRARTQAPVFSSPFVAHGMVYVGSDDHRVYALDAVTGALRWEAATEGEVKSSPAVANGIVYVGSDDHRMYAFGASGCGRRSCPPIWSALLGDEVESSPVVANHRVFVGSADGKLYAFRALP